MSGTTDFCYSTARVKFAKAQINWETATVKCMLVGSSYSPNKAHAFVSQIPPDAIVVRDVAVTAKGVNTDGVCYGAIDLIEALISAVAVRAMVLYIATGVDSTSQLIYYSSTGSGFPFAAEGFDYYITFDQLAGGWFQV